MRKLKVIINKTQSWKSRVVDVESGEIIDLVGQIELLLRPDHVFTACITLQSPDVEFEDQARESEDGR